MHFPKALTLVIATILLSPCQTLSAALGELRQPRLPMAQNFAEGDYAKLNAVLERKGVKYIKGFWLNSHTALHYGGDTIALNLFLEALSECPHVALHVNFYRASESIGSEADWLVTHEAGTNTLVVRINMESKAIDLTKLYLPTIHPRQP